MTRWDCSSESLQQFKLPAAKYMNASFLKQSQSLGCVTDNRKPKTHPVFISAMLSHYFTFYFFDDTIEDVRLFPICIMTFANFLLMCFTHFSAKIFIIFLLIGEGSLHIKALNPLLYSGKTSLVVAFMKPMLPLCVYINSITMCRLSF